ncbi:Na+/H+ antiporter NhaC [Methanohalophilus levihalophilus]|uniref:hypothetical protein n=1 Tax=Methanohalophilus levihalophilus TaxID=1431282 RepID=UPI001AE3ED60|nr:hypothetical protein [Methanohalophilus levihalophilus]MBP2029298.1 Na+/H+ antiporter NhaC [Methanohalophilus levihalophilus]
MEEAVYFLPHILIFFIFSLIAIFWMNRGRPKKTKFQARTTYAILNSEIEKQNDKPLDGSTLKKYSKLLPSLIVILFVAGYFVHPIFIVPCLLTILVEFVLKGSGDLLGHFDSLGRRKKALNIAVERTNDEDLKYEQKHFYRTNYLLVLILIVYIILVYIFEVYIRS